MSLLNKKIKNSINSFKNTITNSTSNIPFASEIDKGVGSIGVSLNNNKNVDDLKDLVDLSIFKPTIANCRRAMAIDPTLSSSVLSTLVLANGGYRVVYEKGVNEDAVESVENKLKEIKIEDLTNGMNYRNLVDGKSFIRETWEGPNLTNCDFMAYDENTYNFVSVHDGSGELLGYKQKGMVYNVPKDWKNASFDDVANPDGEEKEFNFEPWEIIHPKLFPDGQSLVMKAIDDVGNLKETKNKLPQAFEMALLTLGIKVGTSENPFRPFNESDAPEIQQAKVSSALEIFAEGFSNRETKDTIAHTHESEPYLIGESRMFDPTPLINIFKQEIREAILTADSRFNSATTNKSTAQMQMGNTGEGSVVNFVQSRAGFYVDNYIIDRHLIASNYNESVGKIHINYNEVDVENNKTKAEIAQILENTYPSMSDEESNIRKQIYFEDFFEIYDTKIIKDNGKGLIENKNQQEQIINSINNATNILVKNNLIKERV